MKRFVSWLARSRMKKKLEKLRRDPQSFFLDLRRLQPLWRRLGIPTRHTRTQASPPPELSLEIQRELQAEFPTFAAFDLVGENWSAAERKPIAIMIGFNPWKRKFVSKYLLEYRTAYVRGRSSWRHLERQCEAIEGLSFIVWGMKDEPELARLAERQNFPLLRMEDGFIRSAELGSRHTTALSLVLDSRGIYFDASKPSDLEKFLNEHDFSTTPALLDSAAALMQLMRHLGISKYNLGSLRAVEDVLGPRLKRRILVIGQVESDASILHGLGDGWTNLRLIEMARQENEDADIIYRPHPDVTQGFRTNTHTLAALGRQCRVLTEDVALADLFRAVDRVYTLTSLSGFEALIHGLPVTVIGAPFYAGWGLTDDRMAVQRRTRRLTIEQLFCVAYLLYPRYLGSLSDPVRGCLSAMLSVTAQRRQALNASITPHLAQTEPTLLLQSEYWPAAFRPALYPVISAAFAQKLSASLPLQRIFMRCRGDHHQRFVAYFLAGQLKDTASVGSLFSILRTCMKLEHYGELLRNLLIIKPLPGLMEHWAWYCEESGHFEEARKTLDHLAYGTVYSVSPISEQPFEIQNQKRALRVAEFDLRRRDLNGAYLTLNRLLLSGFISGDLINGLVEIARLRFDFSSAAALLDFFNRYDPNWKLGRNFGLQAQCAALANDPDQASEAMSVAVTLNPQWLGSFENFTRVLTNAFGKLPFIGALQASIENQELGSPINRAVRLIASFKAREAESLLRSHEPKPADQMHYWAALSLAYSYQGKLEEAKALMVELLKRRPVNLLYREALRLAVVKNDYAWGGDLLNQVISLGVDVGDMHRRKVYLGMGEIKSSFQTFRDMKKTRKVLGAYFGDRYIQSLDRIHDTGENNVAILGFFGPGDELRFSSYYGRLRERVKNSKLTVTCDPRLFALFTRSFPALKFVASKRARNLASLGEFTDFISLPGSDLIDVFDNNGWSAANDADQTLLATDFLGDFIDGYHSFNGTPYLSPDPVGVARWRDRLKPWAEKPLVGLSWRSSLTTYSRNEHYFNIDELGPLFEVPDVQFVNLQYDECSAELAHLEAKYPGRVLNFPDLDQFNDLDGVAGLMSCMDLIIAPATTVVELAGAVGRPTLLLSNSSELHWRKRPGTSVDVWHRSVTHVEGGKLGDKTSLIDAAAQILVRHPLLTTCKDMAPRKSFWLLQQ